MEQGAFVTTWNHNVHTPPSKFLEYLQRCGIEGIEQRGHKFVFRCPVCGDSAKVKSKKRGYLVTDSEGKGTMGCHNCEHKSSFTWYLKKYEPTIHRKWIQDVYVGFSLNEKVRKENEAVEEEVNNTEEVVDYSLFFKLQEKRDTPVRRAALEFIHSRRIPKHIAKHFLYCESGRYFWRLIIPHYNKDMSFKHFEARDLSKKSFAKYLYPDKWEPNNYNFPNIDLGKNYFAFEGVVDSTFMRNSGACGGAQKYDFFFKPIHKSYIKNAVVFADGDRDGIIASFKLLKKGLRVFKWTRQMLKYGHDLNELVQNGYFADEDFNDDGTVKEEVIMKHVVSSSIGEILCFQMNALDLGVNVLWRKQDAFTARG